MRTYLLLFFLVAFQCNATAQDLFEIHDKLTGETYYQTTWRIFTKQARGFGRLKSDCRITAYNDTAIYFELQLELTGGEYPISPGNKLGFFLKEGDKPELMEYTGSSAGNIRRSKHLFYYPRYKTSKEQLERIWNKKVDHFILQTSNRSFTLDLADGQFYELINLILYKTYPSGKKPKHLVKEI
jgi:hypothetical protein